MARPTFVEPLLRVCPSDEHERLTAQVMAVAAAEARAEGAASRVAALEQQLATAAATDRPASAGGSASGEEFLEVRVAELTAQLHEVRTASGSF